MKCVICSSEDHGVISTVEQDACIRRRRKCARCGHRWTTYELTEERARAVREHAEILTSIRALVAPETAAG
ncbi:MAG: hypothetical protein IPP91_11060 [Betaproteobacteria bacterium]|nr:hypothetical protein [Betaproteobacteria bacterium]